MFSVALSIASRRPAVSRHPALWSPDFPLRKQVAQRLPGQLRFAFYMQGHWRPAHGSKMVVELVGYGYV